MGIIPPPKLPILEEKVTKRNHQPQHLHRFPGCIHRIAEAPITENQIQRHEQDDFTVPDREIESHVIDRSLGDIDHLDGLFHGGIMVHRMQ